MIAEYKNEKTEELLSVSIPTRNRQRYLKELLDTIEQQVIENEDILHYIKIYIFDNASTDDTPEVIKRSTLKIIYKRNPENIGGKRNIYQAYAAVKGKYVWVIGDDELLPKNAIHTILQLIKRHNPCLIINGSNSYSLVNVPMFFPGYLEFIRFAARYNTWLLLGHSLVSASVVLKSCFDADFALSKANANYGSFYGITKGIKNHPGKVICAPVETITVRAIRAPGERTPRNIKQSQINYVAWLKNEYNVQSLMPDKVHGQYGANITPVPPTWKRMLKRIIGK